MLHGMNWLYIALSIACGVLSYFLSKALLRWMGDSPKKDE